MFKHHHSIFVTFDPSDGAKARNFIRSLERRFRDRRFQGRHLSLTDAEAKIAISQTTLTVILETKNTAASGVVRHDIAVSLAKVPQNEIVRILLDAEEQMPDNCAISEMLVGSGTERVDANLSEVAEAFCRLDLLARHEPRIREAIDQKSSAAIPCNRG
ncbi:MAG: hypothetical protein QOI07_3230 [Verrucomicrobiota bacterium]|jgi:hypothetical protein